LDYLQLMIDITRNEARELGMAKNMRDYNDFPVPDYCPDCGAELVEQPLRSAAGWYIGTCCSCGPHSRNSGYFETRQDAEMEMRDVSKS
jgi:hypothetical protein